MGNRNLKVFTFPKIYRGIVIEEQSLNSTNVKTNQILFVHSMCEHNVVINRLDNLKLLPENSFVLKPLLK
jgi:hypothetical protein